MIVQVRRNSLSKERNENAVKCRLFLSTCSNDAGIDICNKGKFVFVIAETLGLLIYCQRYDQQAFCFALCQAKLLLWFQLISFEALLLFLCTFESKMKRFCVLGCKYDKTCN